MGLYSHSKLGTFQTCRLQYKFHYIDKIKVDIDTIERYMGKVAHDTLEKLYKDLLMGKMNTKEAIIGYYEKEWEKGWHDRILIVDREYEAHHYWKRGQRSIADYYDGYYPFDQGKTLGLETMVMFNLDPEGKHKIRGFIDRLVWAGDNRYEIHDYKTGKHPPTDESLKADRQLALYQIFVQERYNDAKDVNLIWHYLTFGKEFSSKRTREELLELKAKTLELVEEVEKAQEFPPRESALCPYCDYQAFCPVRKHLVKVKAMTVEEYLKDDGVKLVNRWTELSENQRLIEKELAVLKEALVEYARRENFKAVRGSSHVLKISEDKYWHFPGTDLKEKPLREALEKIIRENGKFDEVARLDVQTLSKKIIEGKWGNEILEKIKACGTEKTTFRVSKSKLKDEEKED